MEWIYVPFFRKVCKTKYQHKVLDTIEGGSETIEVVNKSGKTVTKHKATLKQFNVINVGVSKFK